MVPPPALQAPSLDVTLRMASSPHAGVIPPAPRTAPLLEVPSDPLAGEPAWVRRSWDQAVRDARRFLATSWAFGRAPRETAARWATGRFDAQNPIGYLLNSLAIMGPWRALWQRLLHVPDAPLYLDLVNAAAPFLGVALVGSFLHLAFRLAGSTRRLASTWAVAMYASAALPVLVIQLALAPLAVILGAVRTPEELRAHGLAYLVVVLAGSTTMIWQILAYAGLHGLRRRRAAAVYLGGLFASVMLLLVGTGLLGLLVRLVVRLAR